jgi:hypothetical protein
MFALGQNSKQGLTKAAALVIALVLTATMPLLAEKGKKKKADAPVVPQQQSFLKTLDYSKIVWPNPPEITRVKYLDFFVGEKFDRIDTVPEKKKSDWMARLAV